MFIKGSTRKILESLDRDFMKWESSEYKFSHRDGLHLWTGNGFLFIDVYPNMVGCFNIIEKVLLINSIRLARLNREAAIVEVKNAE